MKICRLHQDYTNLEIIISDDCSSDRTFDVIQNMVSKYKGTHKIILNKNEKNLGPREHVNKLLYELSHGEYVFLAAGDDISASNRTSRCIEFMEKNPEVSSLSCESVLIDEGGARISKDYDKRPDRGRTTILTLSDYIHYPVYIFPGDSRVLRRSTINAFPPLKYPFAEDVFLFVRSLYIGSVAYLREPLVFYRQRTGSIMNKSRNAKNYDKEYYKNRKETTDRQLWWDFEYAINRHYISEDYKDIVKTKIQDLVYWLRPHKRILYRRAFRRCLRLISKYCIKLDKIIK